MVWTPSRVVLVSNGRHDEAVAGADGIYPGMLLINSGANVIPHNVVGGLASPLMVAKEEALYGGDITQKIGSQAGGVSTNNAIPFQRPARGDLLTMLLQNLQSVTVGGPLMSGGDGTLIAAPAAGNKLYQIVAPSATKDTYTTLVAFSNGSYSIPANTLAVGDIIHIRAKLYQISVNATPTNVLTLKIGSTVIAASPAVSVIAADVIIIDAYLTVRTIGATGTIIGTAFISYSASGTFTDIGATLVSTTLDTTAAATITANTTCSASHASNACRLDEFSIINEKSSGYNVVGYAAETINNSAGAGSSPMSVFNSSLTALIRVQIP